MKGQESKDYSSYYQHKTEASLDGAHFFVVFESATFQTFKAFNVRVFLCASCTEIQTQPKELIYLCLGAQSTLKREVNNPLP